MKKALAWLVIVLLIAAGIYLVVSHAIETISKQGVGYYAVETIAYIACVFVLGSLVFWAISKVFDE